MPTLREAHLTILRWNEGVEVQELRMFETDPGSFIWGPRTTGVTHSYSEINICNLLTKIAFSTIKDMVH